MRGRKNFIARAASSKWSRAAADKSRDFKLDRSKFTPTTAAANACRCAWQETQQQQQQQQLNGSCSVGGSARLTSALTSEVH